MGQNDIGIIAGILFVFVALAIFLPIVKSEFTGESVVVNILFFKTSLTSQVVNEDGSISYTTSIWQVIKTFGLLLTWSFGLFPFWLDAFFLCLKLIVGLTVARNIWIGGGG